MRLVYQFWNSIVSGLGGNLNHPSQPLHFKYDKVVASESKVTYLGSYKWFQVGVTSYFRDNTHLFPILLSTD